MAEAAASTISTVRRGAGTCGGLAEGEQRSARTAACQHGFFSARTAGAAVATGPADLLAAAVARDKGIADRECAWLRYFDCQAAARQHVLCERGRRCDRLGGNLSSPENKLLVALVTTAVPESL